MFKIKNYKNYSLIVILIIAAFFCFHNINQTPPGLYPDEAMNGNNALETLSETKNGFKVFYPENNGREGLFINIQAIFLKFLMPLNNGFPEPWMLRLISAIFGFLTIMGLYFLTQKLFNKKVAFLSSFFLSTSFWFINFSRIGFRAIMAPFFLVWGIYFLLLALDKDKLKTIIFSIIGGAIYGLGFYSYIAYRATPLLILIILFLYWIKNKNPEFRKKILISTLFYIIFTIIIAAPLGLYFLNNPQDFFGRTGQISISASSSPLKNLGVNILKTIGMFNFEGDWNWRHNFAGKPELFWPIGILFIIGIIQSIYLLFKKTFSPIIIFSWLIIAALPVVISNEGIPHALRAILMIPPTFILAGIGGILIFEKIKNINKNQKILKFIIYPSLILILSLFILEAYTTYFIKWGKNSNVYGAFSADYVKIGQEINSLPQETPKYVIVQAKGTNVRGVPMPAQTVMFITDSFSSEKQKKKNIHYLLPEQADQIPKNAYVEILK
ncbi:glycosyltransferase family 39 protein [Candidatus Wolfebacteria bacterium]|nr:glycosyltransferase family 39 protein [Candidatus Wolfebacteria bacterium]